MWTKIKNFFIKIMPTKRKIIQVYAALLHNANMMGFVTGKIFTGDSKIVCAPGLNCYSCPGAVGACPLGTIQNALYESKTKLPTYVLGIILLYCIILGRTVCGWLCPIGLVQELLYKIKTPKLQKNRVTRVLSYFKYVLLVVLVIAVPLIFSFNQDKAIPGFCKYICPAGTLGGAISLLINPANSSLFDTLGPIFTWKFLILVVFVVCSIFIFRFFCRFLCPLGAIYGIFNKLSILGVKVDKSKCDNCGACVAHCKMDVKEVGDHECIMCGECKDVCHVNAIHWKTIGKLVEKDLADAGFVAATDLGSVRLNNSDVEKIEAAETINEVESSKSEALEYTSDIPADDMIEPIINQKKKFRITLKTQKIFKGICYSLMGALLIFTFVYANFLTKDLLNINSNAKEVNINLFNDEVFSLSSDDNTVLIYFYDKYDKKQINELDYYATDPALEEFEVKDKLKVVAVSSYEHLEENKASALKFKGSENMFFGYDDKNSSLLAKFTTNKEYPFLIFTDLNDKILIHTNNELTSTDFSSVIIPAAMGKDVGSQVGQICFSTDLKVLGSDKAFNLSDNKGRITVLNFWATWCGPCTEELPYFNDVARDYKDKLDVVTIHEGDSYNEDNVMQKVGSLVNDGNIIWTSDKDGSPYHSALDGLGYPMTIIVDGDGKIVYRTNSPLSKEKLIEEVEKAINN